MGDMIALATAVLLAMTVVMSVGWFCQPAALKGGWTDVLRTYGTGVVSAGSTLAPFAGATSPDWRQVTVSALVGTWSLRLGTYILVRVVAPQEDARYASLRRDWGDKIQRNMFALMIGQAPATAVAAMPRSKGDAHRRYQERVSPLLLRPPKESSR